MSTGASAFLEALPAVGREQVLATARRRRYSRGEVLVRQGDEATSLFIVEEGRAAVRYRTPGGEVVMLGVHGPGDVFGEMGVLVARHERTASVEALDDVVVRVLRAEDSAALRAAHVEVSDFLLAVLARRADRLTRLVAEGHYLAVEVRVARRLFEVARLFVEEAGINVPLTQAELAQLAGTTRPTANQVLKALERDGVLRVSRGRVEVRDLRELRARCAWSSHA